jgi:enolase
MLSRPTKAMRIAKLNELIRIEEEMINPKMADINR